MLLGILRRVDGVARALGLEYFVGGALARDLLLLHVFGRETGRATRDVDLGICVDDWDGFDALRARLIDQLLRATLTTGDEATPARVERFIQAFADGFRDASSRTGPNSRTASNCSASTR